MNSLSWFIYAIQISEGAKNAAEAFAIISGAVIGCGLAVLALPTVFGDADDVAAAAKLRSGLLRMLLPAFLVALPFAVLLPSRQTLLLIAGSELSQRVANSEMVQSVVDPGLDLLKTWIASEKAHLLKDGSKSEKK